MSTTPAKKTRQMPKGGRTGGTSFPRISLDDALVYSKKLVSKTHTGAQPQDVIFAGVVGAKSGNGRVRIAALKQYGLLKGDANTNYSADELAKRIVAAPADELPPLLKSAVLRPTVFKKIFDAYHGDQVTRAKLRQRALDLKVHLDHADLCVDLYVSGMIRAGLLNVEGDKYVHVAAQTTTAGNPSDDDADDAESLDEDGGHDASEPSVQDESEKPQPRQDDEESLSEPRTRGERSKTNSAPRAIFNVSVTLDSSLDTEKLEKQLLLLKRYGAI